MSSEDKKHRSHLPMATPERTGFVAYDAKDPDSKFPPIEHLRPPKGAPNILVILIDDAGFGSSSAFGGPCKTPSAEMLAAGGLQFNRFHTTALCSPTRQAMLTGRNHHSVGMGGIAEIATGAPGYNSVLPNSISPLSRTLKLNGYSTAQFGKCHEVAVWETSPVGPFDTWPAGGGRFEYFYGFISGEANQWYPTLYEGTTPVEPKEVTKHLLLPKLSWGRTWWRAVVDSLDQFGSDQCLSSADKTGVLPVEIVDERFSDPRPRELKRIMISRQRRVAVCGTAILAVAIEPQRGIYSMPLGPIVAAALVANNADPIFLVPVVCPSDLAGDMRAARKLQGEPGTVFHVEHGPIRARVAPPAAPLA
jgi:hypothetical protein